MIKPPLLFGLSLGISAVMFAACSLGEGVTPDCDPNAAPTADNACFAVAACDTGNGGVKAEDGCCVEVGNHTYESCEGVNLKKDSDFRDLCVPGGATEPSGCCNPAQAQYDLCMMGGLMTGAGGSGGTGGAGGSNTGGAGGAGGN